MENTCTWYDPSCALGWLADEIKSWFLWVYDSIFVGLSNLFDSLPLPDFLLNAQSFTLPATLAWAAEPLNLTYGLSVIVVAYTARFILRRIPFIG